LILGAVDEAVLIRILEKIENNTKKISNSMPFFMLYLLQPQIRYV
jgi:hypothetical protein